MAWMFVLQVFKSNVDVAMFHRGVNIPQGFGRNSLIGATPRKAFAAATDDGLQNWEERRPSSETI